MTMTFVVEDTEPGWKWSTGSEGGASSAHSCPDQGSQVASSDGSQGGVSPPGEESPSTAPPSRSGKGVPWSRKGGSSSKQRGRKEGGSERKYDGPIQELKMRRVDWRWAAAKGYLNKETNQWNDAMGGREEYLRQRNKRMVTRQQKAHDAKEARQMKEALRAPAIQSATNLYCNLVRSRPPHHQSARLGESSTFTSIHPDCGVQGAHTRSGTSSKHGGLQHGDFSSTSSNNAIFNPVAMHNSSPLQFHYWRMDGQMDDTCATQNPANNGASLHPDHHNGDMMNDWRHTNDTSMGMGGMSHHSSTHIWRPAATHASANTMAFHQPTNSRFQQLCRRSEPLPDNEYSLHLSKHDYYRHHTVTDLPHGMDAGALAKQQMQMQIEKLRWQNEMREHMQDHRMGNGRDYMSLMLPSDELGCQGRDMFP